MPVALAGRGAGPPRLRRMQIPPWCTRPQDPSIKQLAEQIATDPTFKDMTEQLQKSMAGMMGPGGEGAAAAAPPNPEEAARNFDPSQYMTAMNSMFQNSKFLEMAEQLGKAIISVSLAQNAPFKAGAARLSGPPPRLLRRRTPAWRT
jgi:hypothetical protein